MKWQPIETAPRDGTVILLWLDPPLDTNDVVGYCTAKELCVVSGWASDTWRGQIEWKCGFCEEGTADTEGYSAPFQIDVNPTHWMPLPPPPTQEPRS